MRASRLKKNDKIGIISPSDPITEDLMPQFNKGINFFRDLGFDVVVAKNALSNTLGYSATPKEKAEDINEMFKDASIKAIICSQGGRTANICLPFLDFEIIGKNPKIFLGMSDITVLLNAIYAKTGLITFHGGDIIWNFGREPKLYDKKEFIDRLMDGKIGLINSNGERMTIRGGTAEGKLLGGNLRCLLKLAGTPYFPDFNESILFLENFGFSAEETHCSFAQLEQMGVFNKVKGIIIGYIYDENYEQKDVRMEDILKDVTAEYQLPILKVNDFGHNCSNTILPVGARVKLNADKQEIEIIDECVV